MDIDMELSQSSFSSAISNINNNNNNKKKKKKKKKEKECNNNYIPPLMDDNPDKRVKNTGVFQYLIHSYEYDLYLNKYIPSVILHRIIRMNSVQDINRFMNCSRLIQSTLPMSCFIPLRTGDDCSEDHCFKCNGTEFIRDPAYRCAKCMTEKDELKKDWTFILGYEFTWAIINNQLRYYRNHKLTHPRELFPRLNKQLKDDLRKVNRFGVMYGWGSFLNKKGGTIMKFHADLIGKFNETYWTLLILQLLEVLNLYLRDNVYYIGYYVDHGDFVDIIRNNNINPNNRFITEINQFGHLIKHFKNVRDFIYQAPAPPKTEYGSFSFRLLADYSEVKQLTSYAHINQLLTSYRDFYSLQTIILHNLYHYNIQDIAINIYVKCPNLNNLELHYTEEDGIIGTKTNVAPEFFQLLQTCKHVQNAVINANSSRQAYLSNCNYDCKKIIPTKFYPFYNENEWDKNKRKAIDSLPEPRLEYLELIGINSKEPIFYRSLALLFPKLTQLVVRISNKRYLLSILQKLAIYVPDMKVPDDYIELDGKKNIMIVNMGKIRELVYKTIVEDWYNQAPGIGTEYGQTNFNVPPTFLNGQADFNDLPGPYFGYPQFNNPNVQNNNNYNIANAGFQSTWNPTMANAFPGETFHFP